jgi:peptidyl-prolyl cis-trans isomerase C
MSAAANSPPRRRELLGLALREPLLHFALIGGLLFALHAALAPGSEARRGQDAPALPLTPLIEIDDGELRQLRDTFRRSWKREPSAEQLGDLVAEFVADEVLLREGLALGLERDDAIVRQRVIEKMRALVRPAEPAPEPSREALQRWFVQHPHRFRQAARIAFDQLYFDPKRRSAAGQDAAAAASSALAQLARQPPSAAPPDAVGDSFVLRRSWQETSEQQIVNVFGQAVARALMAAPLGVWQGPVASEYGVHLLRVSRRSPARMPSFDEAQSYVRADFQLVQARGSGVIERDLLPRYSVKLVTADARALASTPALQALAPALK